MKDDFHAFSRDDWCEQLRSAADRSETCEDGKQPNSDHSTCAFCPTGSTGLSGHCRPCDPGQQPATGQTTCEDCAEHQHSDGSTGGVWCVKRPGCQLTF